MLAVILVGIPVASPPSKKKYILPDGTLTTNKQEVEAYFASIYQDGLTLSEEVRGEAGQEIGSTAESAEGSETRGQGQRSSPASILKAIADSVAEAELGADDDEALLLILAAIHDD
jgi:hypothetical protein|tara:strand:+ start:4515 stop:4862 length:348 start_codon:yes stop_codon:yes gene_type:complete